MKPEDVLAKGSTDKGKRQVPLEMAARLWPTPTANDHKNAGYQVSNGRAYPTLPGAVGSAKFPTPTTQDAQNNGSASQQQRHTRALNAQVAGRLNPRWVEWLMNWPIFWTDLSPIEQDL